MLRGCRSRGKCAQGTTRRTWTDGTRSIIPARGGGCGSLVHLSWLQSVTWLMVASSPSSSAPSSAPCTVRALSPMAASSLSSGHQDASFFLPGRVCVAVPDDGTMSRKPAWLTQALSIQASTVPAARARRRWPGPRTVFQALCLAPSRLLRFRR